MYVFDDTDPEVEAYLGLAEVPLLPLAHDKPVTGQFQLTRAGGKIEAGVIEVELRWQYNYLPPKVPKHPPQEVSWLFAVILFFDFLSFLSFFFLFYVSLPLL